MSIVFILNNHAPISFDNLIWCITNICGFVWPALMLIVSPHGGFLTDAGNVDSQVVPTDKAPPLVQYWLRVKAVKARVRVWLCFCHALYERSLLWLILNGDEVCDDRQDRTYSWLFNVDSCHYWRVIFRFEHMERDTMAMERMQPQLSYGKACLWTLQEGEGQWHAQSYCAILRIRELDWKVPVFNWRRTIKVNKTCLKKKLYLKIFIIGMFVSF